MLQRWPCFGRRLCEMLQKWPCYGRRLCEVLQMWPCYSRILCEGLQRWPCYGRRLCEVQIAGLGLLVVVTDSAPGAGRAKYRSCPVGRGVADILTLCNSSIKLDGVGPLDNRPSTDWLHHFFLHLTHDS